LGVDNNFTPAFKGINKSREIKFQHIYFISKNKMLIRLARKIFPERVRLFLKKLIEAISFTEKKREPLDKDLYQYLSSMYYDEAVKISQYLNRDLVSFWKLDS